MNPTGSLADMLARLRMTLPRHWFADETPILDGVLTGLASAWAWLYAMLSYVRLQTRIATLTDGFLDIAATDYFGSRLARATGEADAAFRARIERELLRERATRPALVAALTDLTGRAPSVFEPARPADTGAYNLAAGYGLAGAWGSLELPMQCFVTAYRPLPGTVAASDAAIDAAVASVMPVAATAWTRISN